MHLIASINKCTDETNKRLNLIELDRFHPVSVIAVAVNNVQMMGLNS